MAAIEEISSTPRRQGETAIPDYGTILLAVRDHSHPLRHLRRIVRQLAENFGQTPTEDMMARFQEAAGHRTDEDLDAAYRSILRDEMKRMPTTGQFLQSCGILRERRKN